MEHISFQNHQTTIQNIDTVNLPVLLREGITFFEEAKEFYHTEETVKEAIDLYLKKLNTYLQEKQKNKPSQVNDFSVVADFVNLHEKTISKETIANFITKLQKAIVQKSISRNSPFASHIEEIQEKLIHQHNQLSIGQSITILINPTWLETLKTLVNPKSNTLSGIDCDINQTEVKKDTLKLQKKENPLFESMNTINQQVNPNTFRLENDFGVFLGDLERFELAITIEGHQGGGKTRFTYQLANAFANLDHRIAIFSLEIGSKSDLIRRMKEDYLEPQNHSNVFIADTLPNGINTIKEAANQFDVVIIDSWNKVGAPSLDFDSLRKEFPNPIFIVIFQRTTQKTIRGGTAPLYDAGINIEVVKADDSFKNNYAVTTKNRYGVTGIQFNIFNQKALNNDEENVGDAECLTINS